jgi:DNA-binding MarR family transcriptional regulator
MPSAVIPLSVLATGARVSRHRIGRWLRGTAEPRLPEFLCLVDVATRRLPDWLATLTDPARLPSLAREWKQLCLAREAAYSQPWSHAVLRALELDELPVGRARQLEWIGERLGIDSAEVSRALEVLERTEQVARTRRGYSPRETRVINTAPESERARQLKSTWARVALERLDQAAPGNFGYALFAVSRKDMVKLRAAARSRVARQCAREPDRPVRARPPSPAPQRGGARQVVTPRATRAGAGRARSRYA